MTYPKFATPGQYKMWIDHITNIKVDPLPAEYDSEEWNSVSAEDEVLSDEEILDVIQDTDEEEPLDEDVKGWKHANRDAAASRKNQNKNVHLVTLKKDGTESKMHDAKTSFNNEDDAREHHKKIVKLNPNRQIHHNLYVDGKHKEKLTEDTSLKNGEVKIDSDQIVAKNQYGKTKTWLWSTKEQTPRYKGKQDLWTKETSREAKKWAKGMNEETITEDCEYFYDPELKSISFDCDGYSVTGLYNVEYDDLFYKIWITRDGKSVYTNDYGKETHETALITDGQIDAYLEKLVSYAMDADVSLHESFEFVDEDQLNEDVGSEILSQLGGNKFISMTGASSLVKSSNSLQMKLPKNKSKANKLKITLNGNDLYDLEFGNLRSINYTVVKKFEDIDVENLRKVFTDYTGMYTSLKEETITEDFDNITMLKNFKGKKVTLKLKDGSHIDVASDEAKIIASRFDELKGDLQKKFADLLNKSNMSFMIAYRDAYKG